MASAKRCSSAGRRNPCRARRLIGPHHRADPRRTDLSRRERTFCAAGPGGEVGELQGAARATPSTFGRHRCTDGHDDDRSNRRTASRPSTPTCAKMSQALIAKANALQTQLSSDAERNQQVVVWVTLLGLLISVVVAIVIGRSIVAADTRHHRRHAAPCRPAKSRSKWITACAATR